MADRYWVGGNGTWNNTSTTNWSATSGGASGASAPTTADNVIFDANSNSGSSNFTVTVGTSATCLDFTTGGGGGALDGTMTLAMSAVLSVFGNLTFPASNLTVTGSSALTFTSTTTGRTITTNGVSLPCPVTFSGVGGGWTLGSALTLNTTGSTGTVTLTNGSFNTGNFNMSIGALASSNSNTRTLTLGSSTITLNGATNILDFSIVTGLTFNSGTSTVNILGTNNNVYFGSGLTWYDIGFTSTTASSINASTIQNTLSCRNLTITGVAVSDATNRKSITWATGVNITCSGSFTVNAGADRASRVRLAPDTRNIATSTITAASFSINDCDLDSINFAGAGIPATGTSIGNLGNCTNVTFTAPKTVYAVGGTGGWAIATRWATSSGGAAALNNVPLGQDTVIIDNNSGAAATNITWPGSSNLVVCFATLDCSARTTALTITMGSQQLFMGGTSGSVNLNANITLAGVATWYIQGAGTTTWTCPTSYNVGVRIYLNARAAAASFQLQNNWTSTTAIEWTLAAGILDLNGRALTFAGQYLVTGPTNQTKNLTYGTGGTFTITPNSGYTSGIFNFSNATNYTYTGSGLMSYTGNGAFAITSLINNTTGLTETNSHDFVVSGNFGSNTWGQGSCNVRNWDLSGLTCGAFSYGSFGTITFYGDVTLGSGIASYVETSTTNFVFASTSATPRTFTNAGQSLPYGLTINGAGGTLRLTQNLTFNPTAAARVLTLTAGTLNLNGFVLTHQIFSSSNSNTRSIDFSVAGSQITLYGNNTTIYDGSTGTNLTFVGTSRFVSNYSGATGTRTFGGPVIAASAVNNPNLYITAGTDSIAFGSGYTRIVDFTGFSGTLTNTTWYVSQPTFSAGMTFATGSSTHTLVGFSGESYTFSSNGRTLRNRWNVDGPGVTFTLNGNFTIDNGTAGNFFQLNAGTLNLSTFTVTAPAISIGGTTARTLTFGTGSKFVATDNGVTVLFAGNLTNLTVNGTARIEFTYSGSVGTRAIQGSVTGATTTNRLNYYITAGTDIINLSGNGVYNGTVDFTGFSGTLNNTLRRFGGDVIFSTGMTLNSGVNVTNFFAFNSLTSTIFTNGKTIPFETRIGWFNDGTQRGTVTLGDAMYVSSTSTFGYYGGSFNTNGFNLTIDGPFSIMQADVGTISFGASTWTVTGTGTAFDFNVANSNMSVSFSPSAQISFTNAGTKTMVPGNLPTLTWPRVCNAGAGALTISGSGYVSSFKNLVSPTTFTFSSGQTYRVDDLEFLGTAGNLVVVQASSTGTYSFVRNSTGVIGCNYMNLSRSIGDVTNGTLWYAGANSTDGGSNTNWIFQNAPSLGNQFFSFMNWA